ncbi:MAG: non-homologous end-joining DNA ligase [Phycisphaerales bacterium JB039]
MSGLLDILDPQQRRRLSRQSQPQWTGPMLATLTHDTFSDPGWIYERKLDGERCLAFRSGADVRLLSRNRKSLNGAYPEIADALEAQQQQDFIVDGEVVAFERRVTSFSRLQHRMQIDDPDEARRSPVAIYYYIFDLLHFEGHDCSALPLRDRKRLLRRALQFRDPLRFTTHRNRQGEQFFRQACRRGWEGLIAKRADSAYVHGRSRNWLKFKCINRQEFVIGGFTDPEGQRQGFGALIVGYYDDGDLVCAGKVGAGFDDDTLETLRRRMDARHRKTSPFDRAELPRGEAHWVRPDLVGEVAFTEWTEDNRLRHPRFLGLRRDKAPEDVVREEPRPAP